MKKRSISYPSKTIFNTKDFVVSVYNSVGDSVPLKYADLAKHGGVAVREADSFAVSANQYGWMSSSYGKGHTPKGEVCKILRKPINNEEKDIYIGAFTAPQLYQSIINHYNGKVIPSEETLEIYLSRNHSFSDSGAATCAKVFLENARGLGLIDSDNVFKIDSEVVISAPEKKPTKLKEKKESIEKKKNPQQQSKTPEIAANKTDSQTDSKLKKIPVFVRGMELHLSVLEDMTQSDWDAIIKQIQTIKAFAR